MPEIIPQEFRSLPSRTGTRRRRLLEQAIRVGSRDASAAYLLAMCYKRLGRNADARTALSRIGEPDANVHLQRGLLAFAEKDFAQAEADFARSWEMVPSYPAGYNLFLSRLCQQKRQDAALSIQQFLPLAPNQAEGRFLGLLQALLASDPSASKLPAEMQQSLAAMSVDDEARLVEMLTGLGEFEVVLPLLQMLAQLRPNSPLIWQATFHAGLAHAKDLTDRCHWHEAHQHLEPLIRSGSVHADKLDILAGSGPLQHARHLRLHDPGVRPRHRLFSLGHGTVSAGRQSRRQASSTNSLGVSQQALLEQNIALANEWLGKLDKAETHWNRYFDALELDLTELPRLGSRDQPLLRRT